MKTDDRALSSDFPQFHLQNLSAHDNLSDLVHNFLQRNNFPITILPINNIRIFGTSSLAKFLPSCSLFKEITGIIMMLLFFFWRFPFFRSVLFLLTLHLFNLAHNHIHFQIQLMISRLIKSLFRIIGKVEPNLNLFAKTMRKKMFHIFF